MGQTLSTFPNIPKLSKKKLTSRIKRLDISSEGVLHILPSTAIIQANKKSVEVLGRTKTLIINKSIKNILPQQQPHLSLSTDDFLVEMGKKIHKIKHSFLDLVFAFQKLEGNTDNNRNNCLTEILPVEKDHKNANENKNKNKNENENQKEKDLKKQKEKKKKKKKNKTKRKIKRKRKRSKKIQDKKSHNTLIWVNAVVIPFLVNRKLYYEVWFRPTNRPKRLIKKNATIQHLTESCYNLQKQIKKFQKHRPRSPLNNDLDNTRMTLNGCVQNNNLLTSQIDQINLEIKELKNLISKRSASFIDEHNETMENKKSNKNGNGNKKNNHKRVKQKQKQKEKEKEKEIEKEKENYSFKTELETYLYRLNLKNKKLRFELKKRQGTTLSSQIMYRVNELKLKSNKFKGVTKNLTNQKKFIDTEIIQKKLQMEYIIQNRNERFCKSEEFQILNQEKNTINQSLEETQKRINIYLNYLKSTRNENQQQSVRMTLSNQIKKIIHKNNQLMLEINKLKSHYQDLQDSTESDSLNLSSDEDDQVPDKSKLLHPIMEIVKMSPKSQDDFLLRKKLSGINNMNQRRQNLLKIQGKAQSPLSNDFIVRSQSLSHLRENNNNIDLPNFTRKKKKSLLFKDILKENTFEELFNYPLAIQYYKEYLSERMIIEPFLFYCDVQDFKKCFNQEDADELTAYFLDNYIYKMSTFSLDIKEETRKNIIKKWAEDDFSVDIFEEIEKKYYHVLSNQYFKEFQKSYLYSELEKCTISENYRYTNNNYFDAELCSQNIQSETLNSIIKYNKNEQNQQNEQNEQNQPNEPNGPNGPNEQNEQNEQKEQKEQNEQKEQKEQNKQNEQNQKNQQLQQLQIKEKKASKIDKNLISQLLLMLNHNYTNNYGSINCEKLTLSLPYKKFLVNCSELQNIDLQKLSQQSISTRKSFFINLYNILLVHSLLNNEIPKNYNSYKQFLNYSKYNLGGSIISLSDIKFGIFKLGSLKKNKKYLLPKELKKLEFNTPDPRIHFSLISPTEQSPILDIFDSDTLYDKLNQTTEKYISKNVLIDSEKEIISLPPIFTKYYSDFGLNVSQSIFWIQNYIKSNNVINMINYSIQPMQLKITQEIKFISDDELTK
ncbi:electron carrier/ protein disulfide oxidoreductase [Anaeramoeba flamelloides]|uniref:Electron carrier/ protein disulfide oxidoreductase n=1 Tax=Anaeramoeba flamelloides TaxID=1746091 RepID=A0ABQ8YDT7_9EUKA|nr:electron carrier/ protein disulfide oxidoreductase [Anaeramoeba flamelloides]